MNKTTIAIVLALLISLDAASRDRGIKGLVQRVTNNTGQDILL